MNHSVYGDNKDYIWWRKVANRTALLLAVFIIISGIIGVKITRENKSLDTLKETNTQLREMANSLTEEFALTAAKLEESEKENKKLRQQLFRLKIENAALKAGENVPNK